MVELALVLPILLMLLMSIFEFGRIFSSYLVISNLARDGARYGVVGNSNSQIQSIIISQGPSLDESRLRVTVTPADENRSKGSPLQVEVDYSVPLITPFLADILSNVNHEDNSFPLSAQCSMRVEN
ncbi:MAG: TadE/TadG family type IV pilus assembly protein [Syntrophomonas sp.]